MQLPDELQNAIDLIVQNTSSKSLARAREELTQDYKAGKASLFGDEAKRLVYLIARMPATYAAVRKVMERLPAAPRSLLDLGAGPGTASWAAVGLFPEIEKITLIEKSSEAVALGKKLAEVGPLALQGAEWVCASLGGALPKADAAVLSYVINELDGSDALIEKCWEAVSTLIVIEPGTPRGATIIRGIREKLIRMGAFIAAPCPHRLKCPSDWCHFAARVERTRLHRQIKGGSLGHEDEKFSYLIATKQEVPHAQNRIVRHPMKGSGHVRLTLCTSEGKLEEKVVGRSDKARYKIARNAEWGDPFV